MSTLPQYRPSRRAWYDAHKEESRAYHEAWCAAHPEGYCAATATVYSDTLVMTEPF